MSHGLSQGCSSGAAGPMAAVCTLLCEPCWLPGASWAQWVAVWESWDQTGTIQSVLLCSVSSLCLTRSRLLFLLHLMLLQELSLFPTTARWLLLLLSLLPVASWAAPAFQQLVPVLLIRYNPWLHFSLPSEKQQSCIPYHKGLGCQGLPLPTNLTSIS